MTKILLAGSAMAAALTLIAGPAAAEGRQPAADATPAARATPAKEAHVKRYCVTYSVTESRIPRTVCKTRDDWMRDDNFDPLNP